MCRGATAPAAATGLLLRESPAAAGAAAATPAALSGGGCDSGGYTAAAAARTETAATARTAIRKPRIIPQFCTSNPVMTRKLTNKHLTNVGRFHNLKSRCRTTSIIVITTITG